MYKIKIYEKTIERHHCVANSQVHMRIKNISKELISEITTDIIPSKGEILKINNVNYVVTYVIREINDINTTFTIEVAKHSNLEYYRHGSNAWHEEVPLVCDIEK